MDVKPYWVLVAGFIVLLIFVLLMRTPGRRWHHRLGPGGQRRQPWLGPGGTRRWFSEGFSSGATFTMFGVDWCPHCVKAKPLFESLGSTVTIGDHPVALRYVNPEHDKGATAGYEIEGYPTFYLETDGKKIKYHGPRTAAGFHAFLEKELSS